MTVWVDLPKKPQYLWLYGRYHTFYWCNHELPDWPDADGLWHCKKCPTTWEGVG